MNQKYDDLVRNIDIINDYLSKCLWMDFEMVCSGGRITLYGSIDLHTNNLENAIEIYFELPQFYQGFIDYMRKRDNSNFIELSLNSNIDGYNIDESLYLIRLNLDEKDTAYINCRAVNYKILNHNPF